MKKGMTMIDVREEGRFVNAYVHMIAEDPHRVHVAAINKVLIDLHPSLEAVFKEHVVKIVQTIIESLGGEVDEVVTVKGDFNPVTDNARSH